MSITKSIITKNKKIILEIKFDECNTDFYIWVTRLKQKIEKVLQSLTVLE